MVCTGCRCSATQLWVTGGGGAAPGAAEQAKRIEEEEARIKSIAEGAREIGCAVALDNHGGCFGEPENQLAIIKRLEKDGIKNVGIGYNLHHGHAHLDRFALLMHKMKPRLTALNLNGMVSTAPMPPASPEPSPSRRLNSILAG